MTKSIETIWKSGFVEEDALLAPQINNLYERKSIHTIDRFKRMFKINLIAIVIGSFVPLIWAWVSGIPITGIAIFLLLNHLALVGYKEMETLKTIDNTQNSYHYLKSFEGWLKENITRYTKIYTFFYPLFFLSFIVGIGFSDHRQAIIEKFVDEFPSMTLVGGIPVFFIISTAIITMLLALFGGKLYRFDLNMVYGRIIKKLDEIIQDIEELRV